MFGLIASPSSLCVTRFVRLTLTLCVVVIELHISLSAHCARYRDPQFRFWGGYYASEWGRLSPTLYPSLVHHIHQYKHRVDELDTLAETA